ncbi:cadherin-related family member 5-like [Carcharodon carcharias]|uniref:cadherin-related family member 5-like n=1 Tax=Carcharodon carcharias TaxID=13397 RepID=UPI001B7DFBE4|nr:cadherin-related family member 5-like [Carcharodon carcharias]
MDSGLTFSVLRHLLFILLAALQLNGAAGAICSVNHACCVPEKYIRVEENNPVNFVISNITVREHPVMISNQHDLPYVAVVGDTLQLTKSIDFENLTSRVMIVTLACGPMLETLRLNIEIVNVNDNPATFPQDVLNLTISELFPVNKTWITEDAIDSDNNQIFYSLDQNTDGAEYFRLKTRNTPEIILKKALDYEKTKTLQLILSADDNSDSTNSTKALLTINISVLDEDNKPPVFEPCSPIPNSNANICLNAAYVGTITQNKTETGPLRLHPQQIQAVDGDKGINTAIQYRIIGGDHTNAFKINSNTGDITMIKAVTSTNPIVLTVMAYQENDHYKYTTTNVALNVLTRNSCQPKFAKATYNGNIQQNSEPGSIVIEQGTIARPLRVQAEDCDFPNNINPSITYEIAPNANFAISRDGLIFTETELPTLHNLIELTITATDNENQETAKTEVKVQVISSNAPITMTTTAQGTGPTKPSTNPAGTGSTTIEVKTSTKAQPTVPTTVTPTTTTTHGSGTPKPPTKLPWTGPTTTSASIPSKTPPGPSGSTTAKSPITGTGHVTAPTTVKATTTHGTGTSKPPTKPPGTAPTTIKASTPPKAPPGTPGSTTVRPPGPGPTTNKPHATGSITTNNPQPPGSITPSRNPPDGSGTGPTTPTTMKTTTTHGTGTPKPPTKPPRTGPTTTRGSTPSKAPPGPAGSTTVRPPGPGPTTNKPHATGSITTNNPQPPGSITPSRNPPDGSGTGPTSLPVNSAVNPRLIYEAKHMAALGVPLGILLFISLVIIGILLHKIYLRKIDWEKMDDGSVTKIKAVSKGLVSSGSDKMQFTNEGYLEEVTSERIQKSSWPALKNPHIIESTALAAVLNSTLENNNLTGSSGNQTDPISQRTNAAPTTQKDDKASSSLDETDNDTEVKSILTKERKSDEGYKSVWFKEDIEPEANEEHVIEGHDDEENNLDHGDRDGLFLQFRHDDKSSIDL